MSSYFRKVFDESPQLLWVRSNDEVLNRYKQDHNGREPSAKIKANLANLKSVLRRQERDGDRPTTGSRSARASMNAGASALEALEVNIDNCMIQAGNLGRDDMDAVIRHLRKARNVVVWKSGQRED